MSQLKSMLVALVAAAVAGGALVAAQSTARPGDPTQGRVWIENRAPNEAVPVTIERFGSTPSVHVSSVDASVVLASRAVRQQWEYRLVPFSPTSEASLVGPGNEGWEAVGVVVASGTNNVLMKRPR